MHDEYAPLPEGYQMLEVESISHVAYKRETKQAIIWLTATNGLKIALFSDLADLNRAVLQVQSDPMQTRLRSISGGKA